MPDLVAEVEMKKQIKVEIIPALMGHQLGDGGHQSKNHNNTTNITGIRAIKKVHRDPTV